MNLTSVQGRRELVEFNVNIEEIKLFVNFTEENINKYEKRRSNGDEVANQQINKLTIILAPESPRNSLDYYDDSTYDSFHNFETGKLNTMN